MMSRREIYDMGLDIGRRYAGDRPGFGLAALQECLRHIIPIPHAFLVGMARAHRIAAIVTLRSIADRLLAVACAMLETRTIFDPSFTAKRTSAVA